MKSRRKEEIQNITTIFMKSQDKKVGYKEEKNRKEIEKENV